MKNGRNLEAVWACEGRQVILNARFAAIACLLFATVVWGSTRAVAAEAPYVLGIGDQLAVKVLGREDLSGDFVIGASGDLALPLIGLIPSEGSTVEDVRQVIEERLSETMATQTDVTVDISRFRPFYILGNVRTPGAYPYVPRMTVLHAIALAGGELVVDQRAYQFVQDAAIARKEIGVLKRRRDSLLARRALLAAEQNGAPGIDFPDELESRPDVTEILEKEREIFRTRSNAMAQDIQGLERQAEVFNEEIEALEGQREAIERQMRLVDDDIAAVQDLVRRNLAPRPRLTEQQRERAELDRESRELGAFLARARQGHVNALESVKTRRAEQLRDIAVEMQDINHDLDQLAIELAGARERAVLASSSLAQEQAASQRPAISRYVIVRPTDTGPLVIEADPLTALRADDVLQVQIADGFELAPAMAPDDATLRMAPADAPASEPLDTLSSQSASATIQRKASHNLSAGRRHRFPRSHGPAEA
jgi:protein involved in polysaccharide export with SLBB domain